MSYIALKSSWKGNSLNPSATAYLPATERFKYSVASSIKYSSIPGCLDMFSRVQGTNPAQVPPRSYIR
ncbi:hypothetical protein phiLo_49 [Thermus phage phiLo]|nr:hypothetical protein phiLo_49 [Thermus phage phiLo]